MFSSCRTSLLQLNNLWHGLQLYLMPKNRWKKWRRKSLAEGTSLWAIVRPKKSETNFSPIKIISWIPKVMVLLLCNYMRFCAKSDHHKKSICGLVTNFQWKFNFWSLEKMTIDWITPYKNVSCEGTSELLLIANSEHINRIRSFRWLKFPELWGPRLGDLGSNSKTTQISSQCHKDKKICLMSHSLMVKTSRKRYKIQGQANNFIETPIAQNLTPWKKKRLLGPVRSTLNITLFFIVRTASIVILSHTVEDVFEAVRTTTHSTADCTRTHFQPDRQWKSNQFLAFLKTDFSLGKLTTSPWSAINELGHETRADSRKTEIETRKTRKVDMAKVFVENLH